MIVAVVVYECFVLIVVDGVVCGCVVLIVVDGVVCGCVVFICRYSLLLCRVDRFCYCCVEFWFVCQGVCCVVFS